MQGYLFIDESDFRSFQWEHRRLAWCMTISAVALFLAMANLDLSWQFEFVRRVPTVLEISLRREPDERVSEPPEAVPTPEPVTPATATEQSGPEAAATQGETGELAAAQNETAAPPAAQDLAVSQSPDAETHIDWYESLERAAAAVVAQGEEPQSMHPELDERRRIAAVRYAKSRAKPPPTWWNVEKDVYGRTLLRHGNCYRILDDPSIFNRYAFETFERYLLFCGIGSDGAPRNLPWVEKIRERYDYLRELDDVPVKGE